MKLLLDEHYSPAIADQLQAPGYDVVSVRGVGMDGTDDEPLLVWAAGQQRALLTNNVSHFVPIVQHWAQTGQQHYGVLFTSDASMPRSNQTIGTYLTVLRGVLDANSGVSALVDQVRWLP